MRAIVKLAENEYLEWSTVVDAPVSTIATRAQAVREWGEKRISKADAYGTSFNSQDSRDELLECNRAGPQETHLTLAEIRGQYTATTANLGDEPTPIKKADDLEQVRF